MSRRGGGGFGDATRAVGRIIAWIAVIALLIAVVQACHDRRSHYYQPTTPTRPAATSGHTASWGSRLGGWVRSHVSRPRTKPGRTTKQR